MKVEEKKLKFFKMAKKVFSQQEDHGYFKCRDKNSSYFIYEYDGLCQLLEDFNVSADIFNDMPKKYRFSKAQTKKLQNEIYTAVEESDGYGYFKSNVYRMKFINKNLKALR
jgi:hypothetical protein